LGQEGADHYQPIFSLAMQWALLLARGNGLLIIKNCVVGAVRNIDTIYPCLHLWPTEGGISASPAPQ